MIVEKKSMGRIDGEEILQYRVRNKNGMEMALMNYGATITGIWAPDRAGNMGDVVLGYDDVAGYEKNDGFLGACVGRYANRIKNAQFFLGGREFRLTPNEGSNMLHGGYGWDRAVFKAAPMENGVRFTLCDREGANGFPGKVEAEIKYTLTEENSVRIDYSALPDAHTVLNLTNHSYFNLAGGGEVLDNELMVNARFYTPVDSELIPTGEILPVSGTPFDFRVRRRIGMGFYDHNFALDAAGKCAELYDGATGRLLEVFTDMPGLQVYCSGMLTDRLGKGNAKYGRYSGVCLETQFFPNSPNVPQFPSCELRAGEEYRHYTEYRFSAI